MEPRIGLHSVQRNLTQSELDFYNSKEQALERGEYEHYRMLITKIYPTGIVSLVADTYNFWKVITVFMKRLKDVILARNGKVVLRPDSGDPVKIIVGDPDAEPGSPAYKGAVECLSEIFGGTVSEEGYKTLDQHIGLIYGDSITLQRANQILEGLRIKGFASDNIVFGIGSYTYQCVTRDTYGSAMKATYAVVNGVGRELFKDPKTDSGSKKSAKGLLRVEYDNEQRTYVLLDQQTVDQEKAGLLQTVFENGKLVRYQSLETIQQRLSQE